MKKTPLITLTAALMLAASPAALAQQADQPGQQNQQPVQTEQMREIEVGDLLDREVVDQHGEQVGTISAVVRRGDGEEFFEIQRTDSDRIDLLPLGPVIILDEKIVVQVEDDEIEGAQEQTEEREKRFETVQEEEDVRVGEQLLDQGQQDQSAVAQQGRQLGQPQDWQRQQNQDRFGEQDRQLQQPQGPLEEALRQAGFLQIEHIGRNVVGARAPDGSAIFIHMHPRDMATGNRGEEQYREPWRDRDQRFGQQQDWQRPQGRQWQQGLSQQDQAPWRQRQYFGQQDRQDWRDWERFGQQRDQQRWRDRDSFDQQQDRQRWQDWDRFGEQRDQQRWRDQQRSNGKPWDDRQPWTGRQ